MNLLDLAVKITCDDQASGQVEGIGSKITGALGTAAKVGGAAVAALQESIETRSGRLYYRVTYTLLGDIAGG